MRVPVLSKTTVSICEDSISASVFELTTLYISRRLLAHVWADADRDEGKSDGTDATKMRVHYDVKHEDKSIYIVTKQNNQADSTKTYLYNQFKD